jgi:hypothetical protein
MDQKFIFGSNAGELNGHKINRIPLRPTHVTAEGLLRDTNILLGHFFVKRLACCLRRILAIFTLIRPEKAIKEI